MYKVYCVELEEVKVETDDLGEAIKEAIEWAEWDDIHMQVLKGKRVLFSVDGFAVASELMMMADDENTHTA